ncbi:MAG: metallophosphoesterase [Firmicutes bacterium]|nr:metallophosphoesterase [Bacillota bacterium]
MTRVLVLSDSHGNKGEVERVAAMYEKAVSAVVHLGDCVSDAESLGFLFPRTRIYIVPGNCDAYTARDIPETLEFPLGGKKILLTHGHRFGVKEGYRAIRQWARQGEADICLFGHTHEPDLFYEGRCMMFNPGSLARPRAGNPSYGVISITGDGIAGRIVEVIA